MINKLKSFFVKYNKFLPIIIILVVLIVFAIIATVYLTNTVNTSIYDERKSSLTNTTEASAKTVNTEIKNFSNKADNFANASEHFLREESYIANVISDLNSIFNLTSVVVNTGHEDTISQDNFFLVDSNGKYYSADGKSGRLTDTTYYTKDSADDISYMGTLPHLSFNSDEVFLIIRTRLATPYEINIDNESDAKASITFCAYMCDLTELNATVSSLFAGENNTFIFDRNSGSMLYKQFNLGLLMDGYNIYYKYTQVGLVNGEKADDIIADIKDGKTSVVEMEINDKSYYACSAPLDNDDWSLFFVVQKDYVESASAVGFKRVIYTSLTIAIILCVVVIVMALYMFFNRRNHDKLLNQEILIEKQSELEEALTAAERASRAKTSFLFNMSHDIRTPMNAIMGFTNMAKKNIDDSEKVLSCLDKTQKSSEILLSLINDVLEMSRIESGKVTLSQDEVDLEQSFDAVKPMSDELAKAKNINLTFSYDIKNRYVVMDELRTQRLCMNLISNGIKYTPDGGFVNVKISEVDSDKEGFAKYIYSFEDNGMGMSEEFQQKLFDEYEREENALTKEIQGTGLGLALCKSLVDLMGGEISVKSKLGQGSTFMVTLYFKISNEIEHTIAVTEDTDYTDLANKKVLVVEDNAFNREISRDLLEELGMVVEDANDGLLAVERLKAVGINYYDYILMDIQMPNMDGYEATQEIRRLFDDRHIPIFALSANAFEEDKQKSYKCGMDEHLAKPIDRQIIIAMFKKYKGR